MVKDCTTLIVDDQEHNREILCEILKDTGRVITAENGAQAKEQMAQLQEALEQVRQEEK